MGVCLVVYRVCFYFIGDTSSGTASLESLDLLSGTVASNGSVQSRRYCILLIKFLNITVYILFGCFLFNFFLPLVYHLER